MGETHDKPLPRYVERELRAYLECGILSHGFLRARCQSCGEELVVAFSCKKRGLCPSCNARRMCNTAAHLCDRVFPSVPVRQWVLSTPFEIRFLLARRVDAFNRLMKLFSEEVMHTLHQRAKRAGVELPRAAGVSFPQRFGSALQLNPHVHAVFCDGVFQLERPDAPFRPLPPPESRELDRVCQRVHDRLRRWLIRKGLVRDEPDHFDNTEPETTAIENCARGSLHVGSLERVQSSSSDDGVDEQGEEEIESLRPTRRSRGRYLGEAGGLSLHVGVTATADNRLGRELLLRYCARPALALGRLSRLADGRLAYRLKKPWRKAKTHVVFTPLELLARIAALIPPPRSPLIRFHGAFAAHCRHRVRIVAGASESRSPPAPCLQKIPPGKVASDVEGRRRQAELGTAPCSKPSSEGAEPESHPSVASTSDPAQAMAALSRGPAGRAPTPAALAIPRQREGASRENPWRLDWHTLLKRVHDVDALACPCGGRLCFLEVVTERAVAKPILVRLGLDPDPPPVASPSAASEILDPLSRGHPADEYP